MSALKRTLASSVFVAAAAGLTLTGTGAANAASAGGHDDTRTASGSCSGQADYTYKISDTGGLNRLVKVDFNLDSNKSGRDWTVKIYRDGHLVKTVDRTTGDEGNAYIDATFVADDDARIKVYAKAGYGEHCTKTLTLDSSDS